MRRNLLLALACAVLSAAAPQPAFPEPVPLGGKVLDPRGKPLPKATVEILPVQTYHELTLASLQGQGDPKPAASATSGPDGRFQVTAPEPGLWRVRVRAEGHVPREYQMLPFLDATELPDAHLGSASSLKVRVLDAQGRPLAGARVAAGLDFTRSVSIQGEWMPIERTGTTGPDGTVTLLREDLEELKVQAVAPGQAEGEARSAPGSRSSEIEIRLAAGCETRVEVVDRESKPAAGTLVAFTRLTGGLTDDAGRVNLTLPCGKEVKLQAGLADGRKVETVLGAKRAAGEPVRFRLPAQPLRLAGRVLEEGTRQLVAGALVWANDAGRAVWTDRNGAYTVTTPPSPKLFVQAASPRHSQEWATHDPGTAEGGMQDGPSFSLSPLASASGIVVDEAGKPVSGAEVAGFASAPRRPSRESLVRTRSGENGTFRLRLAPGTAYELTVRHRDYAAAEATLPEIAAHGTRKDLRIVLRDGQSASGTVLDSQDRPVAGARVVLFPAMEPDGSMGFLRRAYRLGRQEDIAATSGKDGRFSFRHLTPGRFDLRAQAQGFGPVMVPGLEIPDTPGTVSLGTVILPPGLELAGIVVDSQGRPIAGARVGAGPDASSLSRFSFYTDDEGQGAVTGADGRFVLSGLGADRRMSLTAMAEGYVPKSVGGVELPLAEPLRITLSPGARISGRVLDESRKPVPMAMVMASRAGAGEMIAESAITGEDGRFEMSPLEAGTMSVRAEAQGLLPARVSNLELAPGQSLDGLELVLRAGALVAGQVFGPDGKPVSGAYVSVAGHGDRFSMPGLSDGDGRYRLEGVETGARVVTASHEDYQRVNKDLDVQPGENRLDFRLEGGHGVAGRVVDPAGEPVRGAELYLRGTPGRRGSGPVSSAADGSFRFPGVAAGTYSLMAERQGYAPATLPEVQVAGPVEGLEIRLDRGGVIRGRVTGVDFPDLGKVGVTAGQGEGQAPGRGRSAKLDFRGEYRLEGLAAGEWKVMAFVFEDGRRAEGTVTLPAGGEAVLDLELKAGRLTLSGRVLRRGEPVDGLSVWVQGEGGNPAGSTTTNQDGAFRLAGLEPGPHTLVLTGSGGVFHRQTVDLTADQDLVIELPEGRVSGRVLDAADSTALAEVSVRLEAVDAAPDPSGFAWGRLSATTDSAGLFTVAGLAEGSYRIVARKEGYGPAESTVQVGPGASVEGVRLELSPTQGLTLQVSGPAGLPSYLTVALVDASGRTVLNGGFPVVEGGRVRVTEAPPGSWRLLAMSADSAVAGVPVTVPGPAVAVALPPAVPLTVTVPALAETPAAATLAVQGTDGQPYQTFGWGGGGVLLRQWPLQDGKIALPVPPGRWRLTVTAADGRSWQGEAVAAPGASGEVTLR